MAHTSIQTKDEDHYVAGNSIGIPIIFTDRTGKNREPITNERHVEFYLKHERTDANTAEDALLVKSSEATGPDGQPEITIINSNDGECRVNILKDETSPAVMQDGQRVEEVTMWFCVQLLEGEHRLVTTEWGEWPMISV